MCVTYGVYAMRGRLPGERVLDGVANLGVRPMMDKPEEVFELHFLDLTFNIYDQLIVVVFIQWMRPEAKLTGFVELKEWIERDCARAWDILANTPHFA